MALSQHCKWSQVGREGRRLPTSLANSPYLQPCTSRSSVSALYQARPMTSLWFSPFSLLGCFNQADNNNLQAITRKTPQSVLGNVFYCLRLSRSINDVKLLPPVGVKDRWILWPLAPQLQLHQRCASWKALISFKPSTFFSTDIFFNVFKL